ncbi:MAG: VTT domain-containing protein [Verrucomicrobiae bacterium]|nr:VTT domain-containing protein [Verrucomicrobiae bacterium]
MGLFLSGEEYYKSARYAMLQAQKRIVLLAWEFHSQVKLVFEDTEDGLPVEMGPFLNALLDRNEELEIYILVWDYSLIYMMEREWKIFSDWLKHPHPRLHFESDRTAPSGASHHQKVLSVDDCVVFCGGMDISISRWDTTRHLFEDKRRVNPDGESYDPYHDASAVLTGEAADDLVKMVHQRWEYATGETLKPVSTGDVNAIWPPEADKLFENVEVGCSRIFASPKEDPSQIEQLHLDLFSSARKLIYMENQYFSSNKITESLIEQLQKEDGPEVVILLPKTTSGWLVESTVGLLRDRLLEKLEEADRYDRLRVYAPMTANDKGDRKEVYVHAKLTVVDDRIFKVGSANLSNRSMKVDSECDLTIAFEDEDDRIRAIRHRLLSMHSGIDVEEWAKIEANHSSLVDALDQAPVESGRQLLEPYHYGCESEVKRRLADTQLLDPDDPIDPKYWLKKVISKEERPFVWRRILSIVVSVAVALFVGFAIVWGWKEILGPDKAVAWLNQFEESLWAPFWILLIFVLGGTLGVPLNFMLITTALVMGSRIAVISGVSGALISAMAGFYVGRLLGQPLVEKFGTESVNKLNEKLGERSFRSVAFIRLIPVAPFFLFNLFAGASQLRFKHYFWGTLLGMTPGMCAVVFLANRAEAAVRHPGWGTILVFVSLLVLLFAGVRYLKNVLYPGEADQSS